MSSWYYGSLAGEIGPPDHEFDDPDCACDECQVDRDDEEAENDSGDG